MSRHLQNTSQLEVTPNLISKKKKVTCCFCGINDETDVHHGDCVVEDCSGCWHRRCLPTENANDGKNLCKTHYVLIEELLKQKEQAVSPLSILDSEIFNNKKKYKTDLAGVAKWLINNKNVKENQHPAAYQQLILNSLGFDLLLKDVTKLAKGDKNYHLNYSKVVKPLKLISSDKFATEFLDKQYFEEVDIIISNSEHFVVGDRINNNNDDLDKEAIILDNLSNEYVRLLFLNTNRKLKLLKLFQLSEKDVKIFLAIMLHSTQYAQNMPISQKFKKLKKLYHLEKQIDFDKIMTLEKFLQICKHITCVDETAASSDAETQLDSIYPTEDYREAESILNKKLMSLT